MSKYLRCVAPAVGRAVIRRGTFSLVVSVDGAAPHRQATIVDGWGAFQRVVEREDGHWRLVAGETASDAEFLPV